MNELIWIEVRDALPLHDRLLSIHGGADGFRDLALLESGLAQQRQLLANADRPAIVDLSAAYTYGILRNHSFVDGNKRTGFVVGLLFLELNGLIFSASEEEVAQPVLQLASGAIGDSQLRRVPAPVVQLASVSKTIVRRKIPTFRRLPEFWHTMRWSSSRKLSERRCTMATSILCSSVATAA